MPTINFKGKTFVQNHHLAVKYHQLVPKKELSLTDKVSLNDNLIIQGDNLKALKALLPTYGGKVKCIYIDPPYNTGNEKWVYNDNVNSPMIQEWLGGIVDKEDLTRHDKWLCMMMPRLKLLKELLCEDGSMIISIGYHEVHNLMQLVNEIFPNKQVTCVTVQTSGGKPSGSFNIQHEYLVMILPVGFEANPMKFTGGKSRTPFEGLTLATFNKIQRPNQTYPIFIDTESHCVTGVGESLHSRIKNGVYKGDIENFKYDFEEAPEGSVAIWPITSKGKDCVWRLTPIRFLKDWKKGYIKVSPNRQKNSVNKFSIQYLPEGVISKIEKGELVVNGTEENKPTLTFEENKTEGSDIPTLWLEKEFYSVNGTGALNDLFSNSEFNYPKPVTLVSEIIRAFTSSEDIVLDSFAGSGTTAHAVLELNKEDGENRQFILIEMEQYANSTTAGRIRRLINGVPESENFKDGIGGTFSYFELGNTIEMESLLRGKNLPSFTEFARYLFYTATGEEFNEKAINEKQALLAKARTTKRICSTKQILNGSRKMP